jgi:uncharacterized repeat protein (TIGR01451 family)
VEYAGGGSFRGVEIHSSNVSIAHSTIQYNTGGGVYMTAGTLAHSTIQYNTGAGMHMAGGTLTDSTISHNSGIAIQMPVAAVAAVNLGSNILSDNGANVVQLETSQSLSGIHTWPGWLVNYPIHVAGALRVSAGASLTLPAGLTLRFASHQHLFIYGTLTAQGTADAPITFTSNQSSPQPGQWGGLYFDANSTATLERVIVEYAGGGSFRGVEIHSSNVSIAHSTIQYNTGGGVSVSNNAAPKFTLNTITNNMGLGINNLTPDTPIDARNTWWGHPSGPHHPELNPDGQGNGVSNGVLFNPWRLSPDDDGQDGEPSLVVGSQVTFSLQPRLYTYYKIEPEPGKNLLLTLELNHGAASGNPATVRMAASVGQIPTSYRFDRQVELAHPQRRGELPIAPTVGNVYYVLVYAPFLTSGQLEATLRAEYVDLHLSSVTPNQAGNAGDLTVQIEGLGFDETTTATLISPSGQPLSSREVLHASPTTFFATFDLRGAQTGAYRLEVRRGSDDATRSLAEAVEVTQGQGGRLKVRLEGPDVVRLGRINEYRLVYENVGDVDMPAPFLAVTASGAGAKLHSDGYESADIMMWLASSPDVRGDVLVPGKGGIIEFQALVEQDVTLQAGVVKESDIGFDWDLVGERLQLEGMNESEWQQIAKQIQDEIGISQRQVFRKLRELNAYQLTPSNVNDLIKLSIYYAMVSSESRLGASSLSGCDVSVKGVNSYSVQDAFVDVKLYDGRSDCKQIFPPVNSYEEYQQLTEAQIQPEVGATFVYSRPTIIVTPGWNPDWEGYDLRKHWALAKRLGIQFPEHNIVVVTWGKGATSPPVCNGVEVFFAWAPGCARTVSTRIDTVAHVVHKKLSQLGYSRWGDTVYIGHSFGNAVNARVSSRTNPKGTALMLNAANPWPFTDSAPQPDYFTSFRQSTALFTYSFLDAHHLTLADKTIQYISPDCAGKSCGSVDAHGAGIDLIICFLEGQPPQGCGRANSNVDKALHLIKNEWSALGIQQTLERPKRYAIDASGKIYILVPEAYCSDQCIVIDKKYEVTPQVQLDLTVVRAWDPNDKVAPEGITDQHIVAANSTLNYTINFENLASATAPVQEVRIKDQLDPNLDWTTFQFNSIAYSDRVVPVNTGRGVLAYANVDVPPASVVTGNAQGELAIDIYAELNIQTGQVEWYLKVIDTATGDFPTDPLAGFLPPEDGSGRGQGYVTFSIKPKADAAVGTRITNKASIVFDTNDPIVTNEVFNIVDRAVDLVLLAEASTQAVAGETTSVVFTAINDGPDEAGNVNFTLTLPQGTVLVSLTASQGSCAGAGCSLGTLANGASATITATWRPGRAGLAESSGTLTTDSVEINLADNTVRLTVEVLETGQSVIYLPMISR